VPSLGEHIASTSAKRGDAIALLYEGTSYTFRELDLRSAATAAALLRQGVCSGDRVAVGLPNSPELVITVLGVLRTGAVLVPMNPACSTDEAIHIASDAQVRAAVVEAGHAAALQRTIPSGLTVFSGGVDSKSNGAPPVRVDPESPALIIYTSGTTGLPKGAVLSHRALLSNLTTVADAWRWTAADRLLLTLPCFHLHGLGLGILASSLIGSSLALCRRFVAEEICAALESVQATMFFGVPTMYNRLVALPPAAVAGHDLSRMRLWVSGSAPLSAATFERFLQRFGHALLDRYGMTECGFVLSGPYDEPRRPGVVGRPLPGISVRLVDPEAADTGRLVDVPDGSTGEIVICGPNLFGGYWNRPDDTARAFIGEYLRSGDLALRQPDAMVRIIGRSSVDIIKTRGFKVGAVEIEDCLQRHPDVEEVAVVGVPDSDQGERLVAVITPRSGRSPTAEDIRTYARQHLAPHKTPNEVVFVTEIPRTGPGKFKKKEIIEQLGSGTMPRP
jgi:acyl-CoA synthetase (AMP-forming)/AMP-acid ligase II